MKTSVCLLPFRLLFEAAVLAWECEVQGVLIGVVVEGEDHIVALDAEIVAAGVRENS